MSKLNVFASQNQLDYCAHMLEFCSPNFTFLFLKKKFNKLFNDENLQYFADKIDCFFENQYFKLLTSWKRKVKILSDFASCPDEISNYICLSRLDHYTYSICYLYKDLDFDKIQLLDLVNDPHKNIEAYCYLKYNLSIARHGLAKSILTKQKILTDNQQINDQLIKYKLATMMLSRIIFQLNKMETIQL